MTASEPSATLSALLDPIEGNPTTDYLSHARITYPRAVSSAARPARVRMANRQKTAAVSFSGISAATTA